MHIPSQEEAIDIPEFRLCETLFFTDDGRPWRLHKMPFFKPIYNNTDNRIILKTSRQSTKTTLIRNKLTLRSIYRPGNSALYVAPTGNQVSDFSKKKLDTVFSYNKQLKEAFTSRSLDWNVTFKQFKVGDKISTINLRSVGHGPDGIRGGTYNDIFKDEFQSMLDEHLPVIDECAATFQGPDAPFQAFFCNTGTPLSYENPIEREWNRSKAYEWCITCPHCRRSMDPIGMHNLDPGLPFLWCTFCKKDVNRRPLHPNISLPPEGRWVATNPHGRFPGYRVVRPMMPWAVWRDGSGGILDKLETLPSRQFANEVMGLPFDSGEQPIPEAVIRKICVTDDRMPKSEHDIQQAALKYQYHPKFAGLDWAMNSDEATPSYTKFGIWTFINGKLRLIFAHTFVGVGSSDPDEIIKKIAYWMNAFDVTMLGADYGVGYFEDRRLQQMFGAGKVKIIHYTGTAGKTQTKFDHQGIKYMVPRTSSLLELEAMIKKEKMELPAWEECKEYVIDWTRLTLEISERTRTILFRRNGTDDFAHVANYARLVWRMWQQNGADSENYSPIDDVGVSNYYGLS